MRIDELIAAEAEAAERTRRDPAGFEDDARAQPGEDVAGAAQRRRVRRPRRRGVAARCAGLDVGTGVADGSAGLACQQPASCDRPDACRSRRVGLDRGVNPTPGARVQQRVPDSSREGRTSSRRTRFLVEHQPVNCGAPAGAAVLGLCYGVDDAWGSSATGDTIIAQTL